MGRGLIWPTFRRHVFLPFQRSGLLAATLFSANNCIRFLEATSLVQLSPIVLNMASLGPASLSNLENPMHVGSFRACATCSRAKAKCVPDSEGSGKCQRSSILMPYLPHSVLIYAGAADWRRSASQLSFRLGLSHGNGNLKASKLRPNEYLLYCWDWLCDQVFLRAALGGWRRNLKGWCPSSHRHKISRRHNRLIQVGHRWVTQFLWI
jgi:hypothetical protein